MKKTPIKIIVSATMASIIMAVLTSVALGTSVLPPSGWWTNLSIQNVSTTPAQAVVVTAYDSATTNTYTAQSSNPLWSNWALSVSPASYSGMPSGFSGSGVVSSDQNIAAVTTLQNLPIGSYGISGGTAIVFYDGVNSTSLQKADKFPVVKNNYSSFSTIYYVQNAGSVATTFTADFVMYKDLSVHYTVTTPVVQPNQVISIAPGDAGVPSSGDATLANLGYGTITANDPAGLISAVWFEYPLNQSPMKVIRGTSGFTDQDLGTTGYVASAQNNYSGQRTSIQLVNGESTVNTVTINYTGTGPTCVGQVYSDTVVLQPNAGALQLQFSAPPNAPTHLPVGCLAAATLTGTGRFMAVGNEGYVPGHPTFQSCTKAAFVGGATLHVAAPLFQDDRLVTVGGVTRNFRNGLFVQNTSSTASAHVVANFYCNKYSGTGTTPTGVFTATTGSMTITGGSSFLFRRPFEDQASIFAGGTPFPQSDALCSVVVTSSDQPLVGFVSQSEVSGATDKDEYNAFNLP